MKNFFKACLLFGVVTLLFSPVYGSSSKDIALVLKTRGKVQVGLRGQRTWKPARRGIRLDSGEKVRTGNKALAALMFTDDRTLLKVRSNSNVTIQGKREKKGIVKRISLAFGQLWAKVTKQHTRMRVETPSGVATVKGTEFNALYADGQFYIFCQKGLIEFFNQFGTMLVGANEMARMVQGSPPERIEGDPNAIFDLSDDEAQELKIEFEDEDGNKKTLILDF